MNTDEKHAEDIGVDASVEHGDEGIGPTDHGEACAGVPNSPEQQQRRAGNMQGLLVDEEFLRQRLNESATKATIGAIDNATRALNNETKTNLLGSLSMALESCPVVGPIFRPRITLMVMLLYVIFLGNTFDRWFFATAGLPVMGVASIP